MIRASPALDELVEAGVRRETPTLVLLPVVALVHAQVESLLDLGAPAESIRGWVDQVARSLWLSRLLETPAWPSTLGPTLDASSAAVLDRAEGMLRLATEEVERACRPDTITAVMRVVVDLGLGAHPSTTPPDPP